MLIIEKNYTQIDETAIGEGMKADDRYLTD